MNSSGFLLLFVYLFLFLGFFWVLFFFWFGSFSFFFFVGGVVVKVSIALCDSIWKRNWLRKEGMKRVLLGAEQERTESRISCLEKQKQEGEVGRKRKEHFRSG